MCHFSPILSVTKSRQVANYWKYDKLRFFLLGARWCLSDMLTIFLNSMKDIHENGAQKMTPARQTAGYALPRLPCSIFGCHSQTPRLAAQHDHVWLSRQKNAYFQSILPHPSASEKHCQRHSGPNNWLSDLTLCNWTRRIWLMQLKILTHPFYAQ